MTAFLDYYAVDVVKSLGRILTQEEIEIVKLKYIIGWHPIRTANYIKTGKDE